MTGRVEAQAIAAMDTGTDITLATVPADGIPRATRVGYVNDGIHIYIPSDDPEAPVGAVFRDAKVSVTINRAYRDWQDTPGVCMNAVSRSVTSAREHRHACTLLARKYPRFRRAVLGKARLPDLLRVDPRVLMVQDPDQGTNHMRQITDDKA